jgi:rod shape-determining protein MreC
VADYFDDTRGRGWKNLGITLALLVLALFLGYLPSEHQTPIRQALRATVLQPFVWGQAEFRARAGRAVDVPVLRSERDSLSAVVAAQASLAEENRRLRELLGLRNRAPDGFIPAELLRVGMRGGQGTFLLSVGRDDGVEPMSPVIAAGGLLGVVWEVSGSTSLAIDWTHEEFRASAMVVDGSAYGLIRSRAGVYREEDQMALVGTPFHVDVRPGTRVVTSGRGDVHPRGILLGTVVGIEDADTGWRKSYLVRPAVRPEAVTHVLVGIARGDGAEDLSPLWTGTVAPDTAERRELP